MGSAYELRIAASLTTTWHRLATCSDRRRGSALSGSQTVHDAAPQAADAFRNVPRNQSIAFACQPVRFRAVVPEAVFIHRDHVRRPVVPHDAPPLFPGTHMSIKLRKGERLFFRRTRPEIPSLTVASRE